MGVPVRVEGLGRLSLRFRGAPLERPEPMVTHLLHRTRRRCHLRHRSGFRQLDRKTWLPPGL